MQDHLIPLALFHQQLWFTFDNLDPRPRTIVPKHMGMTRQSQHGLFSKGVLRLTVVAIAILVGHLQLSTHLQILRGQVAKFLGRSQPFEGNDPPLAPVAFGGKFLLTRFNLVVVVAIEGQEPGQPLRGSSGNFR